MIQSDIFACYDEPSEVRRGLNITRDDYTGHSRAHQRGAEAVPDGAQGSADSGGESLVWTAPPSPVHTDEAGQEIYPPPPRPMTKHPSHHPFLLWKKSKDT